MEASPHLFFLEWRLTGNLEWSTLNIKVILCVTFIDFLRFDEFTWDTFNIIFLWWYVIFNRDDSVIVILFSLKIDSFKHEVMIELAVSLVSPLCPIFTFHYLYSHFSHDSSHSLFSHIIDSFNKQYFITKVKELLLRVDISTTGFSNHFLRKEAVIFATINEISREEIKLLSR